MPKHGCMPNDTRYFPNFHWVLPRFCADTPTDRLPQLAEAARREGATLCIMEPYADVERRNCCRHLAAEHPSTSIDNRGYLLLFNGTLPKQHFKL